jgi:protein HOOK3
VAAFKPLMESYKTQIIDLETKNSSKSQEIESLTFEMEQNRTKLKITLAERAKDAETLELYQERVRELELIPSTKGAGLGGQSPPYEKQDSGTSGFNDDNHGESLATDIDDHTQGLGGELDDAIAGTTMTDLKIQVRRLNRELEAVKKNEADASRLLVLENLLEDANRMKARYECDYLAAHREKLVLQRDLEEIRNGKSLGDGWVLFLCQLLLKLDD